MLQRVLCESPATECDFSAISPYDDQNLKNTIISIPVIINS